MTAITLLSLTLFISVNLLEAMKRHLRFIFLVLIGGCQLLASTLFINTAFASPVNIADISIKTCTIVEGKKIYSPDTTKFSFFWDGLNALVKVKDQYGSGIIKLNCSFIDTRNWVCGGETDFYWDPQSEGQKKYFTKDVYQKIDGEFSLIESKFKDGTLVRLRDFPKSCEPKIN